ncbi:MAG TPA: hypothetical protein VFV39_04285, partial [Limnobacter sp.]|nr:hypothetical protein [Limnobacter sp.]
TAQNCTWGNVAISANLAFMINNRPVIQDASFRHMAVCSHDCKWGNKSTLLNGSRLCDACPLTQNRQRLMRSSQHVDKKVPTDLIVANRNMKKPCLTRVQRERWAMHRVIQNQGAFQRRIIIPEYQCEPIHSCGIHGVNNHLCMATRSQDIKKISTH